MQRTKVLLLCGGESSEHEVSISSARNVFAAIDDTKFDVILSYIDTVGRWWLIDSIDGEIITQNAPQIVPVLGGKGFTTLPNSQTITPDVIFPVLHGKNGEDGSIQGLAQLMHIPVVGCDTTASAVCMDKVLTKQVLVANGIDVVPYEVYRRGEVLPDFSHLSMNLGVPLFVKPARSGSSVGVSRVYSEDEFIQSIKVALLHSDSVLIERGVTGRELEIAVLGNPPNHQVSCVGEVLLGDDFYTYEEKYAASSGARTVIPAESLDDAVVRRIQSIAAKAFRVLGGTGLSRVDFFLSDSGDIYLNEVNTMPGFTNISMYSKLWRPEGLSYAQLVEDLISLALEDNVTVPEPIVDAI